MNEKLLEIQELNLCLKKNGSEIHVLKDVNFFLNKGEIVGLVGESGCGKSLTVNSILRLLPNHLHKTTGQIIFENQNLLTRSEKQLRHIRGRKIGVVFQDPTAALNPTLRIGTQLIESLVTHNKELSKKEAVDEGLKWLNRMSIGNPEQRFKQYPHELSGGMKQRIAIAMALICNPALLLADEPTTALDVTVQAEILNLLKQLCREMDIGILLITHDLGVVANCCHRVLIMRAGKIIESADVNKIFTDPQHPYTNSLLKSKKGLSKGLL